jgi:8-oxo-dGTP pyrophosphatase MutT (NUDIX family)
MEETGLTVQVGPPFFTWISGYPAGHRNEGKKVFLIAYLCDYVAGDVSLSHEHEKFRWVTRDDYREADDGTQFFQVLEKYFKKIKKAAYESRLCMEASGLLCRWRCTLPQRS